MTKEQAEIQLRDYKMALNGVTLDHVCRENAALRKQRDALLETLKAAAHALHSFEFGNTSTELANEIAAVCDAVILQAEGRL